VSLAVEVERARVAAVDDLEFLVGRLGLVDDLAVDADADRASAGRADEEDDDEPAGERVLASDAGGDECDRGSMDRTPKTSAIWSTPSAGMRRNVVANAPTMLPMVPRAYTCPDASPSPSFVESSAAYGLTYPRKYVGGPNRSVIAGRDANRLGSGKPASPRTRVSPRKMRTAT